MATLAELQSMKLWNQWGKQRRFGYPILKGLPRPKGWSDLQKTYNENKLYLYNTKKITFHHGKVGFGSTGVRHFKYYIVPPLQYWNPDITFVEVKTNGAEPKVQIELENGTIKEFSAKQLKERDILLKVLLETKTISLPEAFEQQIQNVPLNIPQLGVKSMRSKQRKELEKQEAREKMISNQRQKDDETAKQILNELKSESDEKTNS